MNNTPEKLIEILRTKTPSQQQKIATEMLSEMDKTQSSKIKEILNDKEKIQSVLSSPEAKQLINKLKGKG